MPVVFKTDAPESPGHVVIHGQVSIGFGVDRARACEYAERLVNSDEYPNATAAYVEAIYEDGERQIILRTVSPAHWPLFQDGAPRRGRPSDLAARASLLV